MRRVPCWSVVRCSCSTTTKLVCAFNWSLYVVSGCCARQEFIVSPIAHNRKSARRESSLLRRVINVMSACTKTTQCLCMCGIELRVLPPYRAVLRVRQLQRTQKKRFMVCAPAAADRSHPMRYSMLRFSMLVRSRRTQRQCLPHVCHAIYATVSATAGHSTHAATTTTQRRRRPQTTSNFDDTESSSSRHKRRLCRRACPLSMRARCNRDGLLGDVDACVQ